MLDYDFDLFDATQLSPDDPDPEPDHNVKWGTVLIGAALGGFVASSVYYTFKTLNDRGEIPPSI